MFDTIGSSAQVAAAHAPSVAAAGALAATAAHLACAVAAAATAAPPRERRQAAAGAGAARAPASGVRHDLALWLTRMLDEIDYGMVLVDAGARVNYMNHAARLELDGEHPLQLAQTLGARRAADAAQLLDALAAAQRGRRGMLILGDGAHRVSISVIPLPAQDDPAAPAAPPASAATGALTLLVLGKRQVCEQLSVHGFARSVHLTAAETRVLEALCAGVPPTAVARQLGVALSTVRTQINSVRAKTGAASIRELVRQVAVLPPLVGVLRS